MSRFRPPPTRRVRPTGIPSAGSACWAYSRKPAEIVVRDNPVACETTAIPPQPSALASHAAQSRRVLSSSSGLSTRNFCLIICSSCMYPYNHIRVEIANLFLRKSLGILHEAGHEAPWIIAMDCQPTEAAVRDYGARWAIEPTFSDFKSRGFQLEETQLQAPERLDRLILIMTLAMYWCVQVGRYDALYNPTPVEKKPRGRPILTIGASKRSGEVSCPGSNAA